MRSVAFVNENTLGHGSYLGPLVRELAARPELGIEPHLVQASPLPPDLRSWGEWSIRGLRRWGLDFSADRWRLAASMHVRRQLEELHARQPLHAVVVNTQSVALLLADWPMPVFVCLDATFAELARSPWLAPGFLGRLAAPLTLRRLRQRERALFQRVRGFFPWSQRVAASLREEYGVPAEQVCILPPSVTLQPPRTRSPGPRPQILFVGGHFDRKGGPQLLEAYRRRLRERFDLHIVTQVPVAGEAGVTVHRDVAADSPAWHARWQQADVFVFPSELETFGIVLLEALAFGVPVVSRAVGAAREVLDGGRAGIILEKATPAALAEAVERVFADPTATAARVARGREVIAERYDLATNARRMAERLQSFICLGPPGT